MPSLDLNFARLDDELRPNASTPSPGAGGSADFLDGPWPELADVSDAELVDTAARRLAVPRRDPADSFVLHAPLELMARTALLRHVEPRAREPARRRILHIVRSYEANEPAHFPPTSVHGAIPNLHAAVSGGDLDGVDRATQMLAAESTASELVTALADLVIPRLSAAGHGSIFLYHLPRLLASSPAAATMARGLLREIARQPTWQLSWMDDRALDAEPSDDLVERLLTPVEAGDPGSNFIYPTMALVERTGLAAQMLDAPTRSLTVSRARRDLLRLAAWSMLQDDSTHAAYGWSHALTMPQAALGVATACTDPTRAIAVAATYVLGFRSTLGRTTLNPSWQPPRVAGLDVETFLDAGPAAAAAAVWHIGDDQLAAYVRRLVTVAAIHEDAHLAKYTLACLDATRDDPAAGRLYLAAAAHLSGWWRRADAS